MAIEPGKAAGDSFRQNVRAADIELRVTLVQVGVGGHSGDAYLVTPESTNSTMAHTVPATASPTLSAVGEKITIATLDDLLDQHGVERADLVKIDCEGAEYDIFAAASDGCLGRIDRIIGEYHDVRGQDPATVFDRLRSAGFSVKTFPFDPESTGWANTLDDVSPPALGLFTALRIPLNDSSQMKKGPISRGDAGAGSILK